MKEQDLRNSKTNIPELDEDLRGKIIDKYENSTKSKFRFKPWHGITLGAVACSMAAVCIIIASGFSSTPASFSNKSGSNSPTSKKDAGIEEYDPKVDPGYHYRDTSAEGLVEPGSEGLVEPGGKKDGMSKEDTSQQEQYNPGQLTASAHDDNMNFDYFQTLVSKGQEEQGLFYEYYISYAFKTKNRIKVTIPDNVEAVCSLYNNDTNIYTSVFDKNGVAYLFSDNEIDENYKVVVNYLDSEKNQQTVEATADSTVDFTSQITGSNNYEKVIDLMVVIDTTGSMGDEINYLKSELTSVINTVKEECDASINLSIIAYRDTSDIYLTEVRDFTNNISNQQIFLDSLSANGGGDFEEAVEVALKKSNEASWSQNSTKVMLFVADAPAHNNKISSWKKEVLSLASKGVRIITLASSGIDKKTEYFFRCQSMMTNGCYTYLTNHSGIGGSHIDATVEEPDVVEYANAMLVRLIKGCYTGIYTAPVPYEQQLDLKKD